MKYLTTLIVVALSPCILLANDTIVTTIDSVGTGQVSIQNFNGMIEQHFEIGLSLAMMFIPAIIMKYIPQLAPYNKAITSLVVMLVIGGIYVFTMGGNWMEVYTSIVMAIIKYNMWGKSAMSLNKSTSSFVYNHPTQEGA